MDSAPDMAHLVAIRTLSSRSTSRVPQVKRAGGSCFVGLEEGEGKRGGKGLVRIDGKIRVGMTDSLSFC